MAGVDLVAQPDEAMLLQRLDVGADGADIALELVGQRGDGKLLGACRDAQAHFSLVMISQRVF
jgi:hypothetical protein